MKYAKILSFTLMLAFVFTGSAHALKPDPKRTAATIDKIFRNFLKRPPSTKPYQGAPKKNEKKQFKELLMSARGNTQTDLKNSLQQKINEMINTLSVRDEYRNKVQPAQWTDKYWRTFTIKLQKDFEQNYNPSPAGGINELVQRAIKKRWGPDIKKTQSFLMTFYKESKYHKLYIDELTHDIIYGPATKPKYKAMLDMTFNRFMARKPSAQGGKQSEVNKFTALLKSADDDRLVLAKKIEELVNVLVERNEFRDRAGYADWKLNYFTKFIQLCAKSFEGKDVGPDKDWATKILVEKGKHKTIRNAQNSVIYEFKKSPHYKNWIKKLALK